MPQFILDYLLDISWVAAVIVIALLIFFWLATRFMYALPEIYFTHRSVKESIVYSWEKTKGWQQVES
ncbi:glycerophosphoryl diester phosphodiesterase membrane domain-containing protein, partial [Streptococcus ruminantium]|nr:glycerophosphoryl diester phosphodiesterase membrane domain-containing protein [Streptococcus ruminantium]